jgi:hypothetical protein
MRWLLWAFSIIHFGRPLGFNSIMIGYNAAKMSKKKTDYMVDKDPTLSINYKCKPSKEPGRRDIL